MRLSAQSVALMAVFAALSAIVIKVFPGIPIVGVSGASIKFDAALAPIYGLVIGPYLGFLAALIGGLVTAGNFFDILTSFSPAVSALIAGLLTQKYLGNGQSKVEGWMAAAVVLGVLVLGWYFTDVGQKAPLYPVLHLAGLALIVATRGWTANAFKKGKADGEGWQVRPLYLLAGIIVMVVAYMFTRPYSVAVWMLSYLWLPMLLIGGAITVYSLFGIGRNTFVAAISIASYCGIIADHMLGNLAFIATINIFTPMPWLEANILRPMGLPDVPSLFMYMIPVSAVERVMLTVVATILGVGLMMAIRRANLTTRKL